MRRSNLKNDCLSMRLLRPLQAGWLAMTFSVFWLLLPVFCLSSCASSKASGPDFYADNIADFRTEKLSNGIPVFFKQNHGSKVVVLRMIFEGGVASYESKKDGIEDFALSLALHGSEKYSYETLQTLEYEKSFSVVSSSNRDFSTAGFTCIFRDLDEVTEIFADSILNPLMSEEDFAQMQTETLDSLESRKANPNGTLGLALSKAAFKNHPYEVSASAREETFSSITLDDLKNHLSSILNAARIKFVVVGDLRVDDTKEFASKLDGFFGSIEKKSWTKPETPALQVSGETVFAANEQAGDSGYISGVFACPERNSSDYIPFAISTMYLDDILFDQVREKEGAVYSIGTGVVGGKVLLGAISVYKGNNSKNLKDLINAAVLSFDEGKTSEKLEEYKNKYISSLFSSSQNAAGIAANMVSSLEYFGSESAYLKRSQKVQAATAKQVNAAYEKYLKAAVESGKITWVVVSSGESVKTFGF